MWLYYSVFLWAKPLCRCKYAIIIHRNSANSIVYKCLLKVLKIYIFYEECQKQKAKQKSNLNVLKITFINFKNFSFINMVFL